MLKIFKLAITMNRTAGIVKDLRKHHNLDVSEDLKAIQTIMVMVKIGQLDNNEIEKKILKTFVAQNNGLFAKIKT